MSIDQGKPEVARIITRLNVGGPARHVAILARELPKRGHSGHLLYGVEDTTEGFLAPPPGIPATRVRELKRSIHPVDDARAARSLLRLLRRFQPSIVHTHMAKAGSLGRWAARQADVPHVVHTFHGHVLQDYFSPPVNRAFISLERFLARKTDVLVAVSEAIRDELLDLGIGRRDQWRVVPLGLDLEALLEDLPDRAESRSTMGLPTEGPIVGIVGRLVPIKEHPLFFRAAARIARERPDIHFVVAGDGELRSTLENEARSLLSDKVTFLGWVDDLPALYSALDVVVLTSRNEGTPVALIEAAAAGRPAVATDVGGVGDVVLHGKTGCLVAPGDEDALARSIIGSLDPIVGAALGRAGREHVADRFSSRRLVHDIAALYDDLLRRPV